MITTRCVRSSNLTIMPTVLPGDQIPARHVNLKLGPGLLQLSTVASNKTTESTVIATRAGTLNHSTNGSKWWIETNSRRVRKVTLDTRKSITFRGLFSISLHRKNRW